MKNITDIKRVKGVNLISISAQCAWKWEKQRTTKACCYSKTSRWQHRISEIQIRSAARPEYPSQQRSVSSLSFWSRAYANLMRARSNVAKRCNATRRPHSYKVGDMVVYRLKVISSKAQNISAKLFLKWSKPVVVAKVLRPNVLLLAKSNTGVIVRTARVSKLKPHFKWHWTLVVW